MMVCCLFSNLLHPRFNVFSFLEVAEHAYQLGNATQKQSLLMELYSTELQLFKDLALVKERR